MPSAPAQKSGGLLGWLGHAAHVVAQKSDLAAHDIAAIPAGVATLAKGLNSDVNAAGHSNFSFKNTRTAGKASVDSTIQSFEHPGRDPFATLLNLAAIAAPVARVALAADAARAAEGASAVERAGILAREAAHPSFTPRTVNVPKLVAPEGEGPAALTHEPVHLQPAKGSVGRVVQRAHDALIQRSLDNNVATAEPSAVSKYAMRRVGKVTSENARMAQRTALVLPQMLEQATSSIVKTPFDKAVPKRVGQLALFLRSNGVLPQEAANYWAGQAARGINPAETGQLSRMAREAHDLGLVKQDAGGKLMIDAANYPRLAHADELLRANQESRAGIINEHSLMNPEGMQNRLDLVAKTMGVDRGGEGFTSLKTNVKGMPQSGIARSRPPLIGRTRSFIGGKQATGSGVQKGLIPVSTTGGVARAAREALRYQGTVTHRGIIAHYGSDVRRTGEDVLIADPAASKYASEIPTNVDQLLGRSKSTLTEADHQGLAAAMKARLEEAIPGLTNNFSADREAGLGTRAPTGYKWVPRQLLGDLVSQTLPRTGVVKGINSVNSAVTAATVYFKLSHIPQRFTTNATTSLISGALKPGSLRAAMKMREALTEREFAEAVSATGTHGYMALPHEGTGFLARKATGGAQWYAHRIDSPFRFLNLVHEARVEGFGTPEKFRRLLAYARQPDAAAPDAARMQYVLNRSNRASMMYDGLGQNEQRILARGLWFYPWTKAAVRYAGHTIGEHPLKAALGGQAGKIGEQEQQKILGDIPSYEYGLLPFGGGAYPETSDPAILTPFGTAANVAELLARPGGLIGNLNPVYGAALTAASGVNQYGNKTNAPIGDAFAELFAPTPEGQILSAYRHPSKPTQVFNKTPLSQFLRAIGGPTVPRKTNKTALNKAAQRERSGR